MTAKQAIKERCKDCCESSRIACNFDSCELKGLTVAQKGCNRAKAIKELSLSGFFTSKRLDIT